MGVTRHGLGVTRYDLGVTRHTVCVIMNWLGSIMYVFNRCQDILGVLENNCTYWVLQAILWVL